MEPRQEQQTDKVSTTEEKQAKPRRFRILKLEERIAPDKGGNATKHQCTFTCGLLCC
jgi:hypothetical protein